MSTLSGPRPATSSGASSRSANEGTFSIVMRSALPSRHSAATAMRPPGASRVKRVSGSRIGRMPASSSTVATQMAFEPDIGGVSSGSMMMKPIAAFGSLAGTRRLTCRKTPPRGSFRRKFRNVPSLAMKRDCSHKVPPGGGGTPPTMTSPTSPSAWQLTTWMILDARIRGLLRCACGRGDGGRSRRALALDARRHVARDRHGALRDAVADDERESHFDIELAPALVQRAGEGGLALDLQRAALHRRVEAAPVRATQMLGDDEIERLAQRVGGGKAEQSLRGAVEAADRSCLVGEDHRIARGIDNPLRKAQAVIQPVVS